MSLRVNPERLVGRPLLKRPIMTAVAAVLNPLIKKHTPLQTAPYKQYDANMGFIDAIPGHIAHQVTAILTNFKVLREPASPDNEYNFDCDVVYIGLKFKIIGKDGKAFKVSDNDGSYWPTFFLDGEQGFLDKATYKVAQTLWSSSGVFEGWSLGLRHHHPQNRAFKRLVSGKNWKVVFFCTST